MFLSGLCYGQLHLHLGKWSHQKCDTWRAVFGSFFIRELEFEYVNKYLTVQQNVGLVMFTLYAGVPLSWDWR